MPRRPLILPLLFLLCAAPVLIFLALAVPTGEAPDEVAHMVRMESLLHGTVIGHRATKPDALGRIVPDSGVTANAGLLAAGFTFKPGTILAERTMTRARAAELAALQWEPEPGFVSVPNTAVYAPLFYAPGALGMLAARTLGHGPWRAIMAARLANAAAYIALGLAALLLARRLRGLLFAVLLLPMSLWLAASCNQDGIMIGTAALAAALLTRGTPASWWAGVAAVALMALAKPLYLPLAGIALALLPGRGALPGLRIAGLLAMALPTLAWYAVAQRVAMVPFTQAAAYQPGPNWPGDPTLTLTVADPALQLQVLLNRPLLLVTLPIRTMIAQGSWLAWEAVGLLGILDILLPIALYAVWLTAIGLVLLGECLASRREPPGPRAIASLWMLACFAATVFAVFDGQYLSWTLTGWAEIQGMQGRYFIPLLPFLGLALPRVRTAAGGIVRAALRAPAVATGAAGLVVIPALVVGTYYLR